MELIENLLEAFNLVDRWKNVPFGHLFITNLQKGEFPNNFMLRFIVRLLDEKDYRSSELWFRISDSAIRFRREEYALITELRFRKISKIFRQ